MPPNLLLQERQAAVIASPKTAALYYDRIFPLPGRPEHIAEAMDLLHIPEKRLGSLLLEDVSSCKEIWDLVVNGLNRNSAEELGRRYDEDGTPSFSTVGERAMYSAASACIHVGDMELVLSEIPKSTRLNPIYKKKKKSNQPSLMVTLVNLNLVDAEGSSWKQILDFREDESARIAFAQLRDFLFTSCSNCSIGEVQDKFSNLLNEYELKSKKHGFEPKAAAFDALFNSQSLIKLVSAGILGAVGGEAVGVSAALASGGATGTALIFDCAKAAIAAKRAILERDTVLETHPANWVFMARKAITTQPPARHLAPNRELSILGRIWKQLSR